MRRSILSWLLVLLLVPWAAVAGVYCDGTNDRLVVANEANFDFVNTTFTISLWLATLDTTTVVGLVTKFGGADGWELSLHNGFPLMTIWDTNNTEALQYESTIDINNAPATWHHVVAVVTTTSASMAISLYVDGVLSQTQTEPRSANPYGPNNVAVLLCDRYLAIPTYTVMEVQEVHVWTAGLTQAQIDQLSAGRQYLPPLPVGQALALPLDTCADGADVNGAVFPDRSGGANHATATGGTCEQLPAQQLYHRGVW